MYMWVGNTLHKRWPQLDLEDDTVHTETLILKQTAHTHTYLHAQTDMKQCINFLFLNNFKLRTFYPLIFLFYGKVHICLHFLTLLGIIKKYYCMLFVAWTFFHSFLYHKHDFICPFSFITINVLVSCILNLLSFIMNINTFDSYFDNPVSLFIV